MGNLVVLKYVLHLSYNKVYDMTIRCNGNKNSKKTNGF